MKHPALLLIALVLMIFSCSDGEKTGGSITSITATADSIPAPKVTVIADLPDSLQPRTVELAQAPKPQTVVIPRPKRRNSSNVQDQGLPTGLEAPVTTIIPGTGGLPDFTAYTIQDGLALDAVLCSYRDRSGNLWFGTRSGGVSRFDGTEFKNYTTDHGLADNFVWSITQDRAGNLWFGTQYSGVSRFDGNSFTNYTTEQGLAEGVVYCIMEDQAGDLWFGTGGGGVSRFDPSAAPGQPLFVTYTTDHGLPGNLIFCMTQDQQGYIYLGTNRGLSRFRPDRTETIGSFTTYTTDHGLAGITIWSMVQDRKGNLWLGTLGNGVSRFEPDQTGGRGHFTNFSIEQGLAGTDVRSIMEDQAGRIWIGTSSHGLSRFDPDSRGIRGSFTTETRIASASVWSITEDAGGNLWLSTAGGGVIRYNPGTSRTAGAFSTYTTDQGLPSNIIRSITEDRSGHLWFGGGRGISCYEPDGTGMLTMVTVYPSNQTRVSNSLRSIIEDRSGFLWVGMYLGGVSRYDPGRSRSRGTSTTFKNTQGLGSNTVRGIIEDRTGHLWFATTNGLSRYDPGEAMTGKSITTYTSAQGLATNSLRGILEDQAGHIWIGSDDGGLNRFEPDSTGIGGTVTSYSTVHGLVGNRINSIAEDQVGHLWIGTEGGLNFLSYADLQKLRAREQARGERKASHPAEKIFQSFTTADGLPDNYVVQLLPLPDGKMAIGTNQGISLFDSPQESSEPFDSLTGLETYHVSKGYPVKNINFGHNAMFLDSKGMIWVGTGSNQTALVRFDYQAVHRNVAPPSISLRQISIHNEAIVWHDLTEADQPPDPHSSPTAPIQTAANLVEETSTLGRPFSQEKRRAFRQKFEGIVFDSITPFSYIPQHLVLPYPHNNLTIHYGTNELARPQLIEYQYQLQGYDEGWSPILTTTSATFGNMREGSYTFLVKARYTGPSLEGADEWTEPLSYSFRVLPPWYRSGWAYLIYSLMIIASIWGFLRWRTKALRQQQKVLEQTVEERTAEVVEEQQRANELLLNILPATVAQELKETGKTSPVFFKEVSILFADFKGFTNIVASIPGEKLVAELDDIFKHYDRIMEEVGLEKIQTVGDAYLAACGLPQTDPDHAIKCVHAGRRIISYLEERNQTHAIKWQVRLGIHSGPITAGVIGFKKFSYDIFGDTVNIAARIESSGEAGRINVSAYTYDLIKDHFPCTYRGKIDAKGKGELDMYFVNLSETRDT